MLSMTAVGLIVAWVLALALSVKLGGFIHLLPAVAALLFLVRYVRRAPPPSEYSRWRNALDRRVK